MQARAFPPIIGRRPRVLILGSLPGVRSLEAQQYYAHPANGFWPIMQALLEMDGPLPYRRKVALLRRRRIALWDVLQQAVRPGSADASIDPRTARPNRIPELLMARPTIRCIAFNGASAAALFRRYVTPLMPVPFRDLRLLILPSTSPAHASLPLAAKRARWAALLQELRDA